MRLNKSVDMPALGTPTLDQLRVFLAVAEAGSFSAAARQLNRRQSVISYTIANLEQQLGGLQLFDRGRRRPVLTEAGPPILAEARKLTLGADGLRARAGGLLAGLEAELAVAVDVMMPTDTLVCTLVAFRAAFPTVNLRLYVEALGSVAQAGSRPRLHHRRERPAFNPISGLEQRPIGSSASRACRGPAPSAGPDPRADPRRRRARTCATGADRPVRTDQGPGFRRAQPRNLAAGRPRRQARPAAGRAWAGAACRRPACGTMSRPGGWCCSTSRRLPSFAYQLLAINRTDTPPGPAARWFMAQLAGRMPARRGRRPATAMRSRSPRAVSAVSATQPGFRLAPDVRGRGSAVAGAAGHRLLRPEHVEDLGRNARLDRPARLRSARPRASTPRSAASATMRPVTWCACAERHVEPPHEPVGKVGRRAVARSPRPPSSGRDRA